MTSNFLLSPQQAKILKFIENEIAFGGCPPTYRDIAEHFGYDSVATVQDHIHALIQKKYLEKDPNKARGLRLTQRTPSKDIPVLGSVPAGRPVEALDSQLGYLSVPAQFKGDLYALRVRGESMRDAGILDGDFVIVRKQSDAHPGEIVVAMIQGEVTVKYLEKKKNQIRLLPANPEFDPIVLSPNEDHRIQGKVVSVHRYYSK